MDPSSSTAKASLTDTAVEHNASAAPRRVQKTEGLITVEPILQSSMQPSYKQEVTLDDTQYGTYGAMLNCLGNVAGTLGSIPCCFCCPNPFRSVQQGSVGLISKFGQFSRSVDPGLVKINPYSEKIKIVDVKIQVVPVQRQSCVTFDNVTVEIDSVIYYHITNPFKAAYAISDVRTALLERAQTTLRTVIGGRNLQSVLSERESIAAEIESVVEEVASRWGVAVESILIKDVIFSTELQSSLSSAAQQKRIGEARVIAAKSDVDAAKLLREAADILSSPAAMQIRQLETLQVMAKSANTKCIFVPMNLFTGGAGELEAAASGSGNGNAFSQAGLLESMSNSK